MASATLRPTAPDWLALADGIGHAQPRYGREKAACGNPRIEPRFAHPIKRRCTECLDLVGISVTARTDR